MKKIRVETKKDVDVSLPLFVCFVVIAILLFLVTKNFLLSVLFAGFAFALRLFSGKLIVYPGDEIFVFGLPGSGKTMFLSKIAKDNKKRGRYIFVNKELEHLKIKDAVIERSDLGLYSFGTCGRSGIVLYDECSLNGFDNRNYSKNFAGKDGEKILSCFKKARHRYQGIVLANQGYDELDKKVRDGLVKCAYWVKNRGFYSVAIRLTKDIKIDDITGQPIETYMRPSIFDRIVDPNSYIYIFHRKYGKLYNTINDDTPFYFDDKNFE